MNSNKNILFEKFEIIETLKKDQHAGVYLADHIYLGKKIILKSLNIKSIAEDSVIERFKREAKILAQLDHPNIIKVLDFGTSEDYFYISFEYFDSRNLREVINENDLSPEQKRSVIVQILKGLDYAHANGIIHRDIKPENILLSADQQIKIGDFGLAQSSTDKFVTTQYSIVGTPSYMSPEQIVGEKLDERTDLFSAGILFLELLSGRNLFLGSDAAESMNNIVNLDEDEAESSVGDIDDDLQKLITGLLKKNVNQRIGSANDALQLLGVEQEIKIKQVITKKKKSKAAIYFLPAAAAIILAVVYFLSIDSGDTDNLQTDFNPKEIPQNIIDTASLNSDEKNNYEIADDVNKEAQTKIPKDQNKENDDSVNLTEESKIEETENNISKGKLFVDVFPYAYVYIDSQLIETTPLKNNIELESGIHQLELVHPDYPKYKSIIEIGKNDLLTVRVNLDTLFGFLAVEVFPWGKIYLNGKYFAETPVPVTKPLKLFPGEYQLSVRNPQFESIEQKINITSSDTLKMQFRF